MRLKRITNPAGPALVLWPRKNAAFASAFARWPRQQRANSSHLRRFSAARGLARVPLGFLINICLALSMVALSTGCKKTNPASPAAADPIARGKQVYLSNCIACHSADPRNVGVLGPEVWGSSRELLEARLLRAAYPEGYKPKRETKTMVAIPHLKDDMDALHAFLNGE